MSATSEGMLVVAPDRTIRILNERAAEMFGVNRAGAVGLPIDSLDVPDIAIAVGVTLAENTHVTTRLDDSETMSVRRRQEASLSSTRDGLLVFDTENRITFVNPAAEAMLDRGSETL